MRVILRVGPVEEIIQQQVEQFIGHAQLRLATLKLKFEQCSMFEKHLSTTLIRPICFYAQDIVDLKILNTENWRKLKQKKKLLGERFETGFIYDRLDLHVLL